MSDAVTLKLIDIVRADPGLVHVLRTVRELDLPDWRLVSGAVYQAVWNAKTGRPAGYGIKDYDVAYFDGSDLSYEAEDGVIKRVAAAFDEPFRSQVEVRNQARVHLWFENRFGEPYEPLGSTDEALGRFVAPTFAVGVRLEADDAITVAAPFGLEDVFAMVVRPNPNRPVAKGWARTIESARGRWPELTVVESV
ncbi:nucleotidyltransferase family protein [Brevundimonas aurantiaca]|uniref:nucleotidyltransferase family protein n=1 Tax=Brevundimonas aurantiaca TaxID=74316 RepID=UPI00174D25F3|nr:nucleotidyltransferase family protein [Brevundimonas aurantiaca]